MPDRFSFAGLRAAGLLLVLGLLGVVADVLGVVSGVLESAFVLGGGVAPDVGATLATGVALGPLDELGPLRPLAPLEPSVPRDVELRAVEDPAEADAEAGEYGGAVTSVMTRPVGAAELDPRATGPIATPISTPADSMPTASAPLQRLPGNRRSPSRPRPRIIRMREPPGSIAGGAVTMSLGVRRCIGDATGAPQFTQ